MKSNSKSPGRMRLIAALGLTGALAATGAAQAQIAGTTVTGVTVSVTETEQLAAGWSVRKSVLGHSVHNEKGDKIGKVMDLIVTPASNVSFVIIGAGGFIGVGRHDIAIPVSRLHEEGGRIVMAGATKASLKAMPQFEYLTDTSRHDRFVARAEQDIGKGRARLVELRKSATDATAELKARIDPQIVAIEADLSATESRLDEMKHAGAGHWHEFEGAVNAATERLRKSVATPVA